jgi:uncharacterized Zn-binding protein involved in type VI secretion
MPGIVRQGDPHVGHASPTPSPFHQTTYVGCSPDVYVNGKGAVRIGDATGCGDPAAAGSPDVYVNGIKVHRLGDGTGGHGSWVPNASAGASGDVFANGGEAVESTYDPADGITSKGSCSNYDWNSGSCLDQSDNPEDPYYVS